MPLLALGHRMIDLQSFNRHFPVYPTVLGTLMSNYPVVSGRHFHDHELDGLNDQMSLNASWALSVDDHYKICMPDTSVGYTAPHVVSYNWL